MIKVDIDNLKVELSNLSSSMADFEPYSNNFIENTVTELDGMNSDFITKVTKTLNNMTDTKAPDLMNNLQDFYTSLDALITDFESTDVSIANGTNLGE